MSVGKSLPDLIIMLFIIKNNGNSVGVHFRIYKFDFVSGTGARFGPTSQADDARDTSSEESVTDTLAAE